MAERVIKSLFVRDMVFLYVGFIHGGHTHKFGHLTYIVRGAVRVTITRQDGTLVCSVIKRASDGDNYLFIDKDLIHEFESLEDNTLAHCIYSHRFPQKLLEYQGKIDQEYDDLLARLMIKANEKYGDVVQTYQGYEAGHQ